MCGGWPDTKTEAQVAAGSKFGGEFKLQGSYNLCARPSTPALPHLACLPHATAGLLSGSVKETEPRLRELMKEAGIEAGDWTLPVFICEQLQSATILPVFFSPEDLAATWEKAGRSKDDLPEALTVMDLRMLVAQMQTDSSPWEVIHFIVPPDAIELVKELQGGAPATPASAATAAADADDDDVDDGDDDDDEEATGGFFS